VAQRDITSVNITVRRIFHAATVRVVYQKPHQYVRDTRKVAIWRRNIDFLFCDAKNYIKNNCLHTISAIPAGNGIPTGFRFHMTK
jgi:hypothetical protein